eukprot:TRINITY_DN809_c0_g1_i2.p1 TRINITY_DN809_c0_g1~~TRINITY_DN809_c0_g1_i2.p1  ORF type:complete len:579 (-),score=149.64 TRINITY_DN809_c0_g1_i2:32-1720(-)
MAEYTEETFETEDAYVEADLPSFRSHATKFDDNIEIEEEGTTQQSSSDSPAPSSSSSQPALPDVIKNFILYFVKQVREKNVYEIHNLYENSFNKLSERWFKASPWPSADIIRTLVDVEKDAVFLILYKELYYRHIYTKLQPTLAHRFESWQNYIDLFQYFLKPTTAAEFDLMLPNQWLWDIVDEFIYQFQSFSQFRYKLKNKSTDEISQLKANQEAWRVDIVITTLQNLISKSKIVQTLDNEKLGIRVDETGKDFNAVPLYKMLGYFSLISLLRIHCLLGDYQQAMKVIEPVDVNRKGPHTRVMACHISLYYYMGFTYLMLRRYTDAIRAFSTILLYINRTKQYHTRSYQYDEIVKKNEQMYALLAIAVCLCPQRIEETVHSILRDKNGEKMMKMQNAKKTDEATYEELFLYACPKFINPAIPNYDDMMATSDGGLGGSQEVLLLQAKIFMNDVKQQASMPIIRSYLKLYSTISTSKMSDFLEIDQDVFRTNLVAYKHKTRNIVWNGGSPMSGKLTATSDVDFYLDKDMINILEAKVTRRYGEFFIRHINKFEEIVRDVAGR